MLHHDSSGSYDFVDQHLTPCLPRANPCDNKYPHSIAEIEKRREEKNFDLFSVYGKFNWAKTAVKYDGNN